MFILDMLRVIGFVSLIIHSIVGSEFDQIEEIASNWDPLFGKLELIFINILNNIIIQEI